MVRLVWAVSLVACASDPVASLDVDPEAVDFGEVVQGAPASFMVHLESKGDAPLELVRMRIIEDATVGFDFATPLRQGEIPAGGRLGLQVTYRGQVDGTATLEIVSNDARSPALIPLRGRILTEAPDAGVMDAMIRDAEIRDVPMGCTGVCGDTNQNGLVDVQDREWLEAIIGGTQIASMCAREDADILRDGRLSQADLFLLTESLGRGLAFGCERCDWACGDVNADGAINQSDSISHQTVRDEPGPRDACQVWRSDTNADGRLTVEDAELIVEWAFGGGPPPNCPD